MKKVLRGASVAFAASTLLSACAQDYAARIVDNGGDLNLQGVQQPIKSENLPAIDLPALISAFTAKPLGATACTVNGAALTPEKLESADAALRQVRISEKRLAAAQAVVKQQEQKVVASGAYDDEGKLDEKNQAVIDWRKAQQEERAAGEAYAKAAGVYTSALTSTGGTGLNTNTALARFRDCSVSPEDQRQRRNHIQGVIMITADRRCEVYKQTLSGVETSQSFFFGSLSTITGALGGLLKGASQELSAAAGISSGLNAEFNQAVLKDTAVSVIYAGIDMKRLDIASEIAGFSEAGVEVYTLERALGDAIRYAGACSMVEGLKHVKDVIARPVGLETAQNVIRSVMDQAALMRIHSMALKDQDGAYQELTEAWKKRSIAENQARQAAGLSTSDHSGTAAGGKPSKAASLTAEADAQAESTASQILVLSHQVAALDNQIVVLTGKRTLEEDVAEKAKLQNSINALTEEKKKMEGRLDVLRISLKGDTVAASSSRTKVGVLQTCIAELIADPENFGADSDASKVLTALDRLPFTSEDEVRLQTQNMDRLRADVPSLTGTAFDKTCRAVKDVKSDCGC